MKILKTFFILIIILSGKTFAESNKKLSLDTNEVKFTSNTIKVDGEELLILSESDLLGTVSK